MESDDLPREPRPMIERIGLALVAAVLGAMFGGVAVAAWFGGEGFLAAMGAVGAVMTLWVGLLTLVRG
jgi:hypothetical protein